MCCVIVVRAWTGAGSEDEFHLVQQVLMANDDAPTFSNPIFEPAGHETIMNPLFAVSQDHAEVVAPALREMPPRKPSISSLPPAPMVCMLQYSVVD